MTSNRSNYPKYNYIAEKFDEEKLLANEEAWQNLRGFVPKHPYIYAKRGNPQLALPVFSYWNSTLLCYQLRDFATNIIDYDSRYSVTKKISGSLFKPDEDRINASPVILESLYEAALLRLYGINACATLGVKNYRMKRVDEIFQDREERYYVIGDNDKSGRYFGENFGGFPLIFDTSFKDLNEFYKHDLKGFEKYMEFLYDMTNLEEDSPIEEMAWI